MEYCPITSLRQYIEFRGYIWEDEAKIILKQILNSLVHIHSKKVWHRDIKPENCFADYKNFKIGDFGEAKEFDLLQNWRKTFSYKGTRVGTKLFKAIELLRGEKYSMSIDLYSVFVLFYEMLTGLPPFYFPGTLEDSNIAELIERNLEKIYSR